MRFASFFFDSTGRAFRVRPTLSKLIFIISGASSGGLITYADAKTDLDVASCQGPSKKKVVVLGTGWGSTSFLRNLDSSLYDVQVISPRNYFTFTPLLPNVTSGTVEARSIVEPIRTIIKKEDVAEIFRIADIDNSGTLTVKEIQDVLEDICKRYPQVELYLKSKHMSSILELLKDSKHDVKKEAIEVDIEEFKRALADVDSQVKTLPATAQVAAQQGDYLARCFNKMNTGEHFEGPLRVRKSGRHRFQPFRYKHFGQFAPLGGEQAAAQLPGDWVSIGHSTQWLWYSVYASKQVSWRTRLLVVSDWTKRFIFGRDSSRI